MAGAGPVPISQMRLSEGGAAHRELRDLALQEPQFLCLLSGDTPGACVVGVLTGQVGSVAQPLTPAWGRPFRLAGQGCPLWVGGHVVLRAARLADPLSPWRWATHLLQRSGVRETEAGLSEAWKGACRLSCRFPA